MKEPARIRTFLFMAIDGETPKAAAMARLRDLARTVAQAHRGELLEAPAGNLRAAFQDPVAAVTASVAMLRAIADDESLVAIDLRCGLHAGPCEQRGNELYGVTVNRAAHLMAAAHGGQVLASQAVADGVAGRLAAPLALRDVGVVRLRDLCRAERIYQVAAPQLRDAFPPLRSLEDIPNNLPEAPCSFVGRAREIGEIRALLAADRLVTLVGMGGVGKTRLSLHVAAESIESHRDGVWLVELGPVLEARHVMQAIASVLGVNQESGEPAEKALAAHVKSRALLIVLDNCEHVLEGVAAAARQLLAAGERVHILATSREPLRAAGESLYLVPGLAIPRARATMARDAVARYYSVRLFVDRARAAAPDFELTTQSAPAIAGICARLDGIPLAIELAAARVSALPLQEMAAAINERFRLLGVRGNHAMPRQRILRAMIDWSHEMLPDDERALFRRLAVFAGTWTLETAEEVCGAQPGARPVAELLAGLAGKSLIAAEESPRRFRMLETVREYAHHRLAEAAEAQAAGDRHLECYVRFATDARPKLAGPDQAQWLVRLDAERQNILAAHEWAGRRRELAPAGLKLANAIKLYWMNRGLLHLGLQVTLEALRRAGPGAAPPDRAQGLFNAGQIRYFMGHHAKARYCLEQSLGIARELGQGPVATVLQPLGMAALAEGDFEKARACFQEAVDLCRARGDKHSLAGALNALAMFHRVAGSPERSRALYEDVVRLACDCGDDEVQAIGLLNLAMVSLDEGAPRECRKLLEEALRIATRVRSAPASQGALDVCAALASIQGDGRHAATFFGAAQAQADRSAVRRDAADAKFLEPKMARVREALGAGAFRAAQDEGRKWDLQQALREADAWLVESSAAETGGERVLTASR